MTISMDDFDNILTRLSELAGSSPWAVAISGGPDSMALGWLLSQCAKRHGRKFYAYTVDHGLRPESASEAQWVSDRVKNFPCTEHKILKWEGVKPQTRILEEARRARYELLSQAAKQDGCDCIFVAHHRDDQAETFLIRLAKGSGLDGLAGMAEVQEWDGIKIIRPLLSFSKQDLIDVCVSNDIEYVEDPTNQNEDYTRPRLRAAQKILEEEGLTSKRLAVTAKRIARARKALEVTTKKVFDTIVVEQTDDLIVLDFATLRQQPEDIVVRVILTVIDKFCPRDDYGPRLERVENLVDRMLYESSFKGATLSGCIFSIQESKKQLRVRKEG